MAIIMCYDSRDAETALHIWSYFLCGPVYELVHRWIMDRCLCYYDSFWSVASGQYQ